MGSRRRAAAIASPARMCAFSRTRRLSIPASKVARSTAEGDGALLTESRCGDSSFMTAPSRLFVDVVVGGPEHVQVIQHRRRIVGPVHRFELVAAAAAGSPSQGFESCCPEPDFGSFGAPGPI